MFLLLIPLLSLSADKPFRAVGRTNEDQLRVRSEPTLTGEVVGSLAVNTEIEILDVTPEEMLIGTMSARWYKIHSLPGGDPIEGWAYGYFIDVRPEDLLAIATWVGQPPLVQELIEAGADVNAHLDEEGLVFDEYDEYSYSSVPVVEAVMAQNVEIVNLLLAAGANPDAEYSRGEPGGTTAGNALVTAVQQGNTEMVGALVENGADLELEQKSSGGGGDGYFMTPLTAAVLAENVALVELLISSGADVNHTVKYWATFGDGDTWKAPLDIASENGLMEIHFILEDAGGALAEVE